MILTNIKSFLYDKDSFIAIYQNKIYIYNYIEVMYISPSKIILTINNNKISIKGDNLIIIKSLNKEILVEGIFKGISYE